MKTEIYVDGAGGDNSGYGYYVKNTGQTFYEKKPGITNNDAEYMAIISALEKFQGVDNLVIYSDSKNTIYQLNHDYAINAPNLRILAQRAWTLIAICKNIELKWIPRKENIAGKMLGS